MESIPIYHVRIDIANLVGEKRNEAIEKAATELKEKYSDVRFIVTGYDVDITRIL